MLAQIGDAKRRLEWRADEIEAARSLPSDIVAELRAIGIYRMLVPRSHGGLEFDQRELGAVIAALSAVEGAIGWMALIGTAGAAALGQLPKTVFDEIYRDGPDVIAAGSGVPSGKAEIVSGGYRVSGRWPFASGCHHAAWMFGSCAVLRDGLPATGADGNPAPPRMVFLPARDWRIEDTWMAEGLKGTGSHHIALTDAFVPEANTIDPGAMQPAVPTVMYRSGFRLFPTHHAAFAIGLAERAIDDFVALATTGKLPAVGRTPVRESPIVQYDLGRAEAELRAAQALLATQCDLDCAHAAEGRANDLDHFVRRLQSAIWIGEACLRSIDSCYRLGGGSSVYETSPLQRRMRDMRAASQHVWAHLRHYAPAGALRLGLPAVHPANW